MITPPIVNDNVGPGGVYDALHKVSIHQHIIILIWYCYLLLFVGTWCILIKCCFNMVWSVSNNK